MTSARATVRVLLLSWLALVLAGTAWALATPIAGSPDEPAHLVKAASVVRGEWVGTPSPVGHEVTVPQYVAWSHAWTCYAFNAEVPASCVPEMPGDPAELVTSVTMAGLYNPVYYLIVGWPSLVFGDESGIYAMRIVSTVVTTFFVAAAVSLIARWRRPVLPLLAIAVTMTPTLLFLSSAVNPNALEATTAIAVLAGMYTLLRENPRSRWAVALVIIAASLGVTARGLSPMWIALALVLPLMLVRWREAVAFLRRRDVAVGIAVIGLATAASLAWTLGSNSLLAGATDPDIHIIYPGAGSSPISGFFYILVRTVDFAQQLVGLFGWMETWAPSAVFLVYTTLIGGLLAVAVVVLRKRAFWHVIALLGALVFLPAIVQAAYVTTGGYIWQGRYSLPIFAMLMLAAATMLADRLPTSSRTTLLRTVWLCSAAIAAAQVTAFVFVLKRYAVGSTGAWGDFVRSPSWAPPLGTVGLSACFAALCVAAGVAGALALLRAAHEQRERVDADADQRADREAEHHAL